MPGLRATPRVGAFGCVASGFCLRLQSRTSNRAPRRSPKFDLASKSIELCCQLEHGASRVGHRGQHAGRSHTAHYIVYTARREPNFPSPMIQRPVHGAHKRSADDAGLPVEVVELRRGAVAAGVVSCCCRRLSLDAGASVLAIAAFPLPAHRTQRADFPHCALRLASRGAHGGHM